MKKVFMILYLWTVGLAGGLLFWFLVVLGRVRIEGYTLKKFLQFIKSPGGKIVIYNHPSLTEPALLPFLFFPWYLFFPSAIPYSTPDKKNYYDKWWFFLFRPVSIPIVRKGKGRLRSFKDFLSIVREKRKTIILAPEGGRTCRGTEFKALEDGKIITVERDDCQQDGPRIRRFQRGVLFLLRQAKTTFLPVWTVGGDKVMPNKASFSETLQLFLSETLRLPLPRLWKRIRIEIKIGNPIKSQDISRLEDLEDILLRCSGAVK